MTVIQVAGLSDKFSFSRIMQIMHILI